MVYRGISHESLVFSGLYTSLQASVCILPQDGKVRWNTDEYSTAFLPSDLLYFQWHSRAMPLKLYWRRSYAGNVNTPNSLYEVYLQLTLIDNMVIHLLTRVSRTVASLPIVIGHVRYISILTWLRGFLVKLLYLVLFSLYLSLFWELEDKRNLKNLQFWPKSRGAMLEYWYIERGLLSRSLVRILVLKAVRYCEPKISSST